MRAWSRSRRRNSATSGPVSTIMFRTQYAAQLLLRVGGGVGGRRGIAADHAEPRGDLVGACRRFARDEFLNEAGHHGRFGDAAAATRGFEFALECRVESNGQSHGGRCGWLDVIHILQRPARHRKGSAQSVLSRADKVIE